MTKIEQGWQLFKASMAVTVRNRKLFLFPALSGVLIVVMALIFLVPLVVPLVLHPTGYRLVQKEHWEALSRYYFSTDHHHASNGGLVLAHVSPVSSLYLLPIYYISMFLTVFFNVAFYSEIIGALNGQEVSVGRGLALARDRLPSILAWTLMAGVVGWIISAIEERLSFVGQLLTGLLGLAWSVAAVFAVPVIIQQAERNPIKILKQSALTLKQTWGEGLIGYVGFSAANGAIFVCWLVPLLLAIGFAIYAKSVWFIVIAATFWLIGLISVACLSNIAAEVYRCALYIYATEGVVPEPYNQDLLDMAWKVKKV